MKEPKIKDSVVHIKNYFVEMPKKKKITVGVIAGAILLVAIAVTVALNVNTSGYRVLYTNQDAAEASSVYQKLKELGAEPQMNPNGEVMVPKDEYDVWLIQLAGLGYPQSALPYDIFASHSGMTTTEAENKQWLIYQLQDRIQSTLQRIQGVDSSTVTITIPESSDYIWEQATNEQRATAGVLLSLRSGTSLTGDQVTAIKNLVAASVPKMDPADVTVVDAKTSLELQGESETNGISTTQNLYFEQTVQKQLEDNIQRLLAPRYGADGVVAVAKVTLNYDKMITESLELQEKPVDENGEGGGGYTTHTEGEFNLNTEETVGGIVGEEDNTDTPTYGYTNPADRDDLTYYSWSTDIDYSYIKTQVEKGNAILERATVSVMVNEQSLTQARRDELISLISTSVDIAPELIFVSAFNPTAAEPQSPDDVPVQSVQTIWELIPIWIYFVLGGALLLALALIVLLIVLARRRKARKRAQMEAEAAREEEARRQAEQEIDQYKELLVDAAKAGSSAKDDAIMSEVRDFAKDNPEITANLLRSWLKEGE